MREDLSDVIAETFEQSKLPMSLKFVAYGRLLEVSERILRFTATG